MTTETSAPIKPRAWLVLLVLGILLILNMLFLLIAGGAGYGVDRRAGVAEVIEGVLPKGVIITSRDK